MGLQELVDLALVHGSCCPTAAGLDGSSVTSPELVPVCREVFDAALGGRPHQLHRRRGDVVPDGRAQLWQRVNARALTDDGEEITRERAGLLVAEEFARFERCAGDRFDDARSLFGEVALGERFPEFLTGAAYGRFPAEARDALVPAGRPAPARPPRTVPGPVSAAVPSASRRPSRLGAPVAVPA